MPVTDPALRRKRRIAAVSAVAALVIMGALTLFVGRQFLAFDRTPAEFKAYISALGWKSRFAALGIQACQVVLSLIPGEVIEVGLGYTFGVWEGTALCLLGVTLASAAIFAVIKTVGVRAAELFVDLDRLNSLRFLRTEERLNFTVFLLYFIPGTPKDLLTYVVGLTRMRLPQFLVISLIARIPSVVSSTIGGALLGQERYQSAVIVFAVTAVISIGGLLVYRAFCRRRAAKTA